MLPTFFSNRDKCSLEGLFTCSERVRQHPRRPRRRRHTTTYARALRVCNLICPTALSYVLPFSFRIFMTLWSHSQTQTKPSRREGWMTDEEALHQERARACRQCTDFPEQWRSRGMQGIFSPKQIPGQCWSKTKSTPRLITMMFTANF